MCRYGEPVSLCTQAAARPALPQLSCTRVGPGSLELEGVYDTSLSATPPVAFFFELAPRAAPEWGSDQNFTHHIPVTSTSSSDSSSDEEEADGDDDVINNTTTTTKVTNNRIILQRAVFRGLQPNFEYVARLRARNIVGWSTWSRPLPVATAR